MIFISGKAMRETTVLRRSNLPATRRNMRLFFIRLAVLSALLIGSFTTPAIAELNEGHSIVMIAQDCESCDHGHQHDASSDTDEGHQPDHHHCSMTFALAPNACEFSRGLGSALLAICAEIQLLSRSTAPPIQPPAA